MKSYQLRAATDADEAFLERLRRTAYADLFDATWGGWDEAKHQRQFAQQQAAGGIQLIVVDAVRRGMIQIAGVDSEALVVEVAEIQVLVGEQGRGLGGQVLADTVASAHRRGRDVQLSLGLKNRRAYRLYRQLGFVETGRSDSHIHMSFAIPG